MPSAIPAVQQMHIPPWLWFRKTNKRMYQAPKETWQVCPVAGACLTRGSPRRSLTISPYDAALRRHRAWIATDEARMRSAGEKNWSNRSSGSSKSSGKYGGSCCVVWAMSLPNGPCWPPPSTCGLCGAHGAPGNRLTPYLHRQTIPIPRSPEPRPTGCRGDPTPFAPTAGEFAATPVYGKSMYGLMGLR